MSTETTERWGATWTDTGEHPTVTSVATLDGAATDTDLQALLQDNYALRAELNRTRAELAQLQSIVSPLEAPWTPDAEPPTLWTEETLIAQWAAAHRASYDTHNYIADSHRREREAVDSLLDYTEALTSHAPADVWDDALRALTAEPVQVDYSYRQSEAWALADMVVGQSKQRDSVYDQLAPDKIQDDAAPRRERHPEQSTAESDKRAKLLAQAAQGERAEMVAEVKVAFGRVIAPAPAPEPEGSVRESWWSRLVAAIGGATTRRRQTEQDGGA